MDNEQIHTKIKEELTISLESIPSAGYMWEAHYDQTMLELKEKKFDAYPSSAIGGGGVETFVFVPAKAGETTITMCYKRPWEEESAEEKRFLAVISE